MGAEAAKTITVIIPTLNAAGVLENCLGSIRRQAYPQDQIEILIADGGSVDATRKIAAAHGATILDNLHRVAEQGKRLAMAHASGAFVLFMDADNELSSNDFLPLAVAALAKHSDALGLESYYPASPRMSSFCAYLTHTLHISDPVSWIMSIEPVLVNREGEVELWTFPGGSLAYPLGANGFMYTRTVLEVVQADADFEDTHVALKVALSGRRTWLRLKNRGVHHYVVKGLWDFIRKRRRQTYHFLSLHTKSELSWTKMKPRVSPLIACLYCATFVGPLYHTARGLVRTRDHRWLWHPIACLASVFGLAWGILTYLLSPKTADAEARLQPVQRVTTNEHE